ncbi:MAG TPA: hypothetical protein VGM67_08050 [Gemmatimonadaceae bacterium]
MRLLLRTFAVGLACLASGELVACSNTPPDALNLVTQVIDTSVSLGAWVKTHPHDAAGFDPPTGAPNESVCRTANATSSLAGSTVTRYALFYIPDPPPGEAFPSDTAHFADARCMLRAVWTVREVNDTATARQFADTVERALIARLGAGRPGAEISGLGTGSWQRARTWSTGTTRIVLGVAPANVDRNLETGAITRHGQRVIVAAYLSRHGVGSVSADDPPTIYGASHFFLDGADTALERMWIDSTLAAPGIPTVVVQNLQRVLSHVRADTSGRLAHSATLDSALVRAVVATRDSATHLAPPARAATLLAADFVINAYAGTLDADTISISDTRTHRTLRAAGVDYVDAQGPVFVYTRPWLWQAYHTDSASTGGHIAFLELLSHGWTTRPDCADGRDGYSRVITEGEAALAAGDTDPVIHLLVGEAYRDIYSLAHGTGGRYAQTADYAAKAAPARRSAIQHLLMALRTLHGRSLREAAWNDTVRLILGAHAEPSFFCLY